MRDLGRGMGIRRGRWEWDLGRCDGRGPMKGSGWVVSDAVVVTVLKYLICFRDSTFEM